MRAVNLRTEYLKNPIGIDIKVPRFSWNCEGGSRQTAYRIIARDEKGRLFWDSGKVESDMMHLIPWQGKELKSRDLVFWSVQLWDEKGDLDENCNPGEDSDPEGAAGLEERAAGESLKSGCGQTPTDWETASFEMGLLADSDWKARWITGNYIPKKNVRYPADCFRRIITLEKPVEKARIYATACGLYEIRINGEKAGDFCLAPGYTDYRRRIQYQTIDVTELVKKAQKRVAENQKSEDGKANSSQTNCSGNLEITVSLADGWYRGTVGAHGLPAEFGTETKFLSQLELTQADGTRRTIVTSGDWDWSNDGPITFADNKDGERVDSNKVPSYSGKAKVTSCQVRPTASNNVPLVENETFTGEKSFSPSGKLLFNFGQNLAGYISFTAEAKLGQKIIVRLGELLDREGELTLKNIQTKGKGHPTPLQEYHYICHEGTNAYKTTFAISGFQYAEVTFENCTGEEAAAIAESMQMTSYAVYSHIEETGWFTSSSDLLNKFVCATKWSTKSNSADIPTDCPTRERHGWTGDAQIFFQTASYLFDYAAFAEKFLRDVYDWQRKDGCLPQIAPYAGVDSYMYTMNGSVGWSDIGVFMPYQFYQMNGDRRILEEYYDRMREYARFMEKRCGKWGGIYSEKTHVAGPAKKYLVNKGQSYGEWAEPQDVKAFVWTDFAAPHPEVSTAYTAYVMDHMIKIAELLGKEEDIAEYREYAAGCRQAYQELIHKAPQYNLDTDRQAQLVRPLYMNLLDEKDTAYAKDRLIKALDNYGWRLGTGFLSTPFILNVLQDIDVEAAYRLLENEEIPGWLSMPKAGATTIWEAWEGSSAVGEVASLNHYSKGALCQWLFQEMCGIHMAGSNHFRIAPVCGGHITHASAEYRSVYGTVKSGWQRQEDGSCTFTIEIPANTTAEVELPGREVMELPAGKYQFGDGGVNVTLVNK